MKYLDVRSWNRWVHLIDNHPVRTEAYNTITVPIGSEVYLWMFDLTNSLRHPNISFEEVKKRVDDILRLR